MDAGGHPRSREALKEEKGRSMEKNALVYIITAAVAVAFGCLVRNRDYTAGRLSVGRRIAGSDRQQAYNTVAEIAIFGLLSGISACRIAVGGDYWVYWLNFQLIDQGRHVSYEKGFVYLVKFFHLIFGEGSYLPIFGFFSLITVFFFLKSLHDQADCYVFSLFLLLTQGFYFNSMNSVRYYFALALAMYAQKYVLRGEYGKFILWILLGCTIHKSVLLVIPAYIAADLLSRVHLKKWYYALGGALLLSLIFGQDIYRKIIFYFYPYYENSMFDNGQISWANIGKCLGTLVLCLLSYRQCIRGERRYRYYFYLNLFGLVIYCCGSFIPEVSRIGYYFVEAQMFLIPGAILRIERKWLRIAAAVGTVTAFSLYFVMLLRGMYDVEIRLLPYLNWIFN